MSYDSQRGSFSREHIYIVELDLDYCGLTHGDAPCTATETGDDKCFNTFTTCNDLPNYLNRATSAGLAVQYDGSASLFKKYKIDSVPYVTWEDRGFTSGDEEFTASGFTNPLINGTKDAFLISLQTINVGDLFGESDVTSFSTNHVITSNLPLSKTYRFCEARSPHPIAINAIPNLKSVSLTPSKIDISGGMGERSSVSLTFNDHPHNDSGIDPYIDDRTYLATDRGTFWTKLRARNPNYQFRGLRVLTGYLEDGEYKEENFKARHYVIEKMDVSGGTCRITAKDPLKLASAKKAQIPVANSGVVSNSGGISNADVNLTVEYSYGVAGVGDAEYATSGYVMLSGTEIASFSTRTADAITLSARGLFNTTAIAHDEGAAVQQCYQKTDTLDLILYDVLTNFANIDPTFINQTEWATEISENTGIDGNLSGIIAKPTDVNKVIKELSEAKPFSLYWDELAQLIKLDVLKAPPDAANVFDMDENLLSGSVKVVDRPELRASTVYFTFGQIDPTKSLTDPNNYTQTIVRSDTDSITKYNSNQIKTVISRWITSGDKTTAEDAAQLYGRRFADIPREISFSVDAKDNGLNIGENRAINHRDMVDATGLPTDIIFQIISKQEAQNFNYKGIEYSFGDKIAGDNELSSNTIKLSLDEQNVNLYDKYFAKYGAPDASTNAVFEVEAGIVIGSATTSGYAIDTGSSWISGGTITLINKGFIVGAGGDGGSLAAFAGQDGGDAIDVNYDVTIENYGVIGSGGGGGGSLDVAILLFGGGGGAGDVFGIGGGTGASNGTLENGGSSGSGAGNGGGLGEDGVTATYAGGTAGNAINKNGYTLLPANIEAATDIRGTVA